MAAAYSASHRASGSEPLELDRADAAYRAVIARIAAEGDQASGWTVDTAAGLFYAVTLPTPWRELPGTCAWSASQYADRLWQARNTLGPAG